MLILFEKVLTFHDIERRGCRRQHQPQQIVRVKCDATDQILQLIG